MFLTINALQGRDKIYTVYFNVNLHIYPIVFVRFLCFSGGRGYDDIRLTD
jgi:hypothetical protein